jgi:hypothetical protein
MSSVSFRDLFAVCCLVLAFGFGARAQAQQDDPNFPRRFDPSDASSRGMLLPLVVAAASDRKDLAVASTVGGYDSAIHTAVLRALADIQLIGPIDLRFGMTYTPSALNGQVQPNFGLRFRIASQDEHGIDFAAALSYRLERFTEDEGLVQLLFAAGRRLGRFNLLLNAAYGQDPEADDREGEAALACLYTVSSTIQVGLENHLRFDLFSDDPKRAMRRDAEYDLTVGPLAQWSLGPVALLGQVGFRSSRFERVQTGAIALAGLAGSY